jgi:hypothetical protein
MVWFDLSIGHKKVKYTPLNPQVEEYPYCDEQGKVLKRIPSKITEKGYFVDEQGNKHDKAFRLINGKAHSGFTGKIKEVENPQYVEQDIAEDLLSEKEFLVESDDIFNELVEKKQAITFKGWFGNGYKVYKVYIVPSKLYKGFCIMKCGRGLKSDIIKGIVGGLAEHRALQEKLKQVELSIAKVNQTKVDDIDLGF